MLFQGEEYGETAPFRFFSDHIDAEIADATREGRRREFAAFASFEREIPDPQDPETFARSKLTRAGEPDGPARALRGRAGAAARAGGRGAAEANADGRRLTVRRGRYRILANFGEDAVAAGRRAGARSPATLRDGALAAARRGGGPMREIWPGDPFPLGATWDGGGTNFSIFSEHADQGRAVPVRRRTTRGAGRAARSGPRSTGTATSR